MFQIICNSFWARTTPKMHVNFTAVSAYDTSDTELGYKRQQGTSVLLERKAPTFSFSHRDIAHGYRKPSASDHRCQPSSSDDLAAETTLDFNVHACRKTEKKESITIGIPPPSPFFSLGLVAISHISDVIMAY